MLQKTFQFFRGPLRAGPLPISLTACPSPCRSHLPVYPQRIVPIPQGFRLFRLHTSTPLSLPTSHTPFPLVQLNLTVLLDLAHGISSRIFPLSPQVYSGNSSFQPRGTHVSLFQSIISIHFLSLCIVDVRAETMIIYFTPPLSRTVLLAPKRCSLNT